MAETIEKTHKSESGKYLMVLAKYGRWEFREDVSVPDDYEIDKDSEQYKLAKKRLVENIKRKIPSYVE
jgi:hypothetical protein